MLISHATEIKMLSVLKFLHIIKKNYKEEIPRIIQVLCEFIVQNGLQEEGIFRVSASSEKLAELKAEV